MNTQSPNRKIFRTLNKFYGTLFLTMILFLIVASLVVSNQGVLLSPDPGLFTVLKGIAIGITIIMLPLAWGWPQKKIGRIDSSLPLQERLKDYQNALILRFTMTEITAFLVTALFMLTGDTNLMLVLAIILLFYIMSRPTVFKVAADLHLTDEEKHQLMF